MRRNFWHNLYSRQAVFYKVTLALLLVIFIVYCFPKGAKFQYEYQKGKLWQYETLYAPFEFSLRKSEVQIEKEKQAIKDESTIFYKKDATVYPSVLSNFQKKKESYFDENISQDELYKLVKKGEEFLERAYKDGVLVSTNDLSGSEISLIENSNHITEIGLNKLFFLKKIKSEVDTFFNKPPYSKYTDNYYALFFDVMVPNVSVDENFTKKNLNENLKSIVYTRGIVEKGQLIVAKGEVVEGESLNMLNSLEQEYESELWNSTSYNWSLLGYYVLVGVIVLIMILYLYRYNYSSFEDNMKFTLILFNIGAIVLVTSLVIKTKVNFIYLIPYCILPLTLKAFLDLRTGIFIHILTLLLIGFIVPDSFQFVVMQIIAGLVTLINITGLHYRVNLFISAGYITLSYMLTYTCFYLLSEGGFSGYDPFILVLFLLNGFAILFVQPLIYIYEKVFNLVSDVSLLELSDTNSKLLKELAEKAPGTFHHSLQVANLAEAAASEVNANTMLVRVGALYHDIGKMNNPLFFTENQKTAVNPHDELTPKQSARIIINHVIEGIELARKRKLPDRIIDFIRTHHGNGLVYYFYKKQLDSGEPVDDSDFRYPGPIPFSKETAILMMADSVEAASKSLKNPTYVVIDEFVEKIIKKQFEQKQFMNADITLREIEKVKKVLKEKLTNIYHLRIEYPE